ncbi:MAG: transporter [Methyloceanibacter sp.]|jgi:hypothetical protein
MKCKEFDLGVAVACHIAGAVALCFITPNGAMAASQETDSAQQQEAPASQETSTEEDAEYNDQDFTRPLSLFQLRFEYKTTPGSGGAPGTTRQVTSDITTLRADQRIDLAPQWALALRTDLPFLAKNPITPDNPDADYQFGLGDADLQLALVHEIDARWGAGVGARLIAPTGTDDLGSGKWQIMPGFAVRYMLPEIGSESYFVPLLRYDVSFAGNPSKKDISNLQFAPTLNIGLPNDWFFTFYPSPDIRVNYGDPVTGQTGRLFLPFDAMIGREMAKNMVLSLEVGVPMVKEYPVYDFKTEARLNVKF